MEMDGNCRSVGGRHREANLEGHQGMEAKELQLGEGMELVVRKTTTKTTTENGSYENVPKD